MAMVHGCTIGRGSLIGIGAIVLNGAVIGEESLVGAGALVPEGKTFPPRSLIIGTPARVARTLTRRGHRPHPEGCAGLSAALEALRGGIEAAGLKGFDQRAHWLLDSIVDVAASDGSSDIHTRGSANDWRMTKR